MNPSHSVFWQRWRNLMATLGCSEHRQTYQALIAAYSEPQRYYHNLDHLRECLSWLPKIQHLLECPAEVELALWFHDAVYQPRSTSNEIDSAAWAKNFLEDANVDGAITQRVSDYILATQTHESSANLDCQFVLDIDLAILSNSPQRFKQFEEQIRQEYEWVSLGLYQEKRAAMLQRFLAKNSIYKTSFFNPRYESLARRNIEWVISPNTNI
ncbi:hypothetical protein Lepto7376_1636 [[Leptolyngbya] sp. PCC 7376]|uniref:HD domain-containing protein n=1 Tax=[Leptolyngbya] sp. PCC 7376 TaxID=111781 RepID=UPI00029F3A76|nr:hypothetical protein [[Leptolyngbya] sp. PCC 7376]AFY37971.1 hypothetical protein Lepto7376_1636 [[Leptolyngbya] sp. PCC 7376]